MGRFGPTLALFIIQLSYCRCVCYESLHGDFCNSLEDLTTRRDDINVVEVIGGSKQTLQTHYLSHMKNLTRLKIDGSVNVVKEDAFASLSAVEKIELINNQIYEVYQSFFKNSSVKELVLTNNSISYIKKFAFSSCARLAILDLRNNKIDTLHYGVFNDIATLKDLFLSRNNVRYIQLNAFDGLVSLEYLDISHNALTKFLTPELMRPRTYNLQFLNINENKIVSVDVTLLPKLKVLDASRNHITGLANGAFHNNPNLFDVRLQQNNIETLQPDVIPPVGLQMYNLDISLNRLSYLEQELVVRLPKLGHFNLCGNPWQCPCLNLILEWVSLNVFRGSCDKRFTAGELPVCVFTEREDSECKHNVNLYADYKNHINYSAFPPIIQPYHYVKLTHSL